MPAPGDPDLLTLRATRLLDSADIVVHDRLIDPGVLALVAPWAEVIDVGKRPGGPADAQERIHRILVDAAARAHTVVRLKGGDPFVFGRGGEEAEALRAAGIDVKVVPGITSAISGPAAAGIPVTMRGHSSGFTVITAHQDPASEQSIDWDAAARLGTTLVVLMGATRTAVIAERLLTGGLPSDTPRRRRGIGHHHPPARPQDQPGRNGRPDRTTTGRARDRSRSRPRRHRLRNSGQGNLTT